MSERVTVKVEITYSDGSIARVEGDEAAKWAEAAKSTAVIAAIHGCPFPALHWIEEAPRTEPRE
jgi:hypothetical protein